MNLQVSELTNSSQLIIQGFIDNKINHVDCLKFLFAICVKQSRLNDNIA